MSSFYMSPFYCRTLLSSFSFPRVLPHFPLSSSPSRLSLSSCSSLPPSLLSPFVSPHVPCPYPCPTLFSVLLSRATFPPSIPHYPSSCLFHALPPSLSFHALVSLPPLLILLSPHSSCTGYTILRFETAEGTELKDEKAAPPRTIYVVGVLEK